MNILAIDTATSLCAACVYDRDAQAESGRAVVDLGKGHAEHVMAVVGEALEKAGLGYDAIGAVAVSIGPGSFTGVRVGVAAARGLALALKIPAIGVSTLEALAAETKESFPGRSVLAALGRPEALAIMHLDAAGALLDGPRLAGEDEAVRIAQANRPVLAGEAAETLAARADGSFDFGPRGATADILFYAAVAAARPLRDKRPVPFYSRPPDAKPQSGFALPLKGG